MITIIARSLSYVEHYIYKAPRKRESFKYLHYEDMHRLRGAKGEVVILAEYDTRPKHQRLREELSREIDRGRIVDITDFFLSHVEFFNQITRCGRLANFAVDGDKISFELRSYYILDGFEDVAHIVMKTVEDYRIEGLTQVSVLDELLLKVQLVKK